MHEDKWKATDIDTGLLIEKDKSFADLYDKVFEMMENINKRKNTKDYTEWKKQFDMIKSGELGRIVLMEK